MKRVIEGELEVWAGPWGRVREATPDFYIAINGEPLAPVAEDRGLGLPTIGPVGVVIRWPRSGVPPLDRDFWQAVASRLRGRRGRLYIGCPTGLNPTGVALAILGHFLGAADKPVAWVREVFSPLAIATDEEARYVASITGVEEEAGGSMRTEPALVVEMGGDRDWRKPDWPATRSDNWPDWTNAQNRGDVVKLALGLAAREEGVEEVMGLLEIAEHGGSWWASGAVGELEIEGPDSGGWRITLWGGRSTRQSRSYLLSQDPLAREFLRKEAALFRLLAELGVEGERLVFNDYDDIMGLSLDENGRFITPEGFELTPEDAAAYILGGWE